MKRIVAALLAAVLGLSIAALAEGAPFDRPGAALDGLLAAAPAGEAGIRPNDIGAYRVYILDQAGQPVKGAVVQLCDEDTCAYQETGEDGAATFAVEEQRAYEVHVPFVPEGYAPDEGAYRTLNLYSDLIITLK